MHTQPTHAQGELATQSGALVVALLLPGAFAMLADKRHEVRAQCLADMSRDWQAFQDAKAQRAPFWTARVRRSCLSLPLVEDIMQLAQRGGFRDLPVLTASAEAIFKGLNFSHLIEDHNQRQRVREEQARGGTHAISNLGKWKLPLTTKVLSELYHFDEINASSQTLSKKEREMRGLDPKWFARPKGEANALYKQVVGETSSSKPRWPSPSPQSYYSQASELELMRWASQTGSWSRGSLCPWGRSLKDGMVFKVPPSEDWWISLGDVVFTSVLAWPMSLGECLDGRPSFVFRSIDRARELRQFIITDPLMVEVHTCSWLSPLHSQLKYGSCDGVVMLADQSSPMSLLRVAALAGFVGNELPQLRFVAAQLNIDSAGDVFDLVLRLCKFVLGDDMMEGDAGLAVMANRVKTNTVDFDTKMLDQEMVASCLAPDDAKEFEDSRGRTCDLQATRLAMVMCLPSFLGEPPYHCKFVLLCVCASGPVPGLCEARRDEGERLEGVCGEAWEVARHSHEEARRGPAVAVEGISEGSGQA